MAYYLETRAWKALTPQDKEDSLMELKFIQENMDRLPPGHLKTMLSACYSCSDYTIYSALNFRQFNRAILHSAYIFTQDYLSRGI
jgi:hypothetical protein